MSEHMFAMVLSMMKRLPGYHDLQREHRWEDLGPVTSLKNANVLVLGGRVLGDDLAKNIVKTWLHTEFEGGRHQRRIDMIGDIEKKYDK